MVKLKTSDVEVDPCFECRLCETKAYLDSGTRSLDPATGQPLGWVNQCFCANCNSVLTLGYAAELGPGGKFADKPLALIKHIKLSPKDDDAFRDKKRHLNATVVAAAAATAAGGADPDTGIGSHIFADTTEDRCVARSGRMCLGGGSESVVSRDVTVVMVLAVCGGCGGGGGWLVGGGPVAVVVMGLGGGLWLLLVRGGTLCGCVGISVGGRKAKGFIVAVAVATVCQGHHPAHARHALVFLVILCRNCWRLPMPMTGGRMHCTNRYLAVRSERGM